MSIIEKIFLAAALVFSFLLGMLVNYFFDNITDSGLVLLLSIIIISIWLVPLVLLVLFSTKPAFAILTVGIGLLSFLTVESGVYIFIGILLVFTSFIYWFFHVQYVKKYSTGFSVIHALKGWGTFLAAVAVFGGLLSFYSPFATEMLVKPQIPEKMLDSVYNPLSDVILGQLNQQVNSSPLIPSGKEEIRTEFHKGINGSVNELATKYQAYIPFAFAASTFLLFQVIFIPVKYLVIGLMMVLVKLFIKASWLKKETLQITVERVKA